ncbi:MAG: choice-of-anchor Q domain-containing protein, partial [Methanococcaceae archaeon]
NVGTVVDGNHIVLNNSDPTPHVDCIQSYQDQNVTIKNNYFEQTTTADHKQGIYATEPVGTFYYYNNVVNCPHVIANVMAFQNLTTSGNVVVCNNTAIGGGSNTLYLLNAPNAIVKNNIFITKDNSSPVRFSKHLSNYANLNNNIYFRSGGSGLSIVSFDDIGSKTLSALKSLGAESKGKDTDPKLNTDFTLTSTSPAIDGGYALGGVYATDKIGTARPQGTSYDMGAYEYKMTTSITPSTGSTLKAYAYTGTLAGSAGKRTFTGSKGAQVIYMADNTGSAKYTFSIPTSGTWYIWGRFYYNFATPSGANSFNVRLDAGANNTFGNSEIYNKWNWDGTAGSKLSLGTVAAGTHTITVSNRESSTNIMLDMIVLSNDPNYVPSDANFGLGKGDNTEDGQSAQSNEMTPDKFELGQNFPNPFNPSTVIKYSIPMSTEVSIKIYDILGQEVATLVNGMQMAGTHTINFNGANLASGTYIYSIRTNDFFESKKMLLLK